VIGTATHARTRARRVRTTIGLLVALTCATATATVAARARQDVPPPAPAAPAAPPVAASADLKLDTAEAEAVLAIVATRRGGATPDAAAWEHLRATDGYSRLKRREEQMGRPFTDAEFRAFVESPELAARADALAETLARWKEADRERACRLALSYLPKAARLRARVLLMIKPQPNSFVFETDTNPTIFFSLDPTTSREKFENTLAHELHHIGYSSCCPSAEAADAIANLRLRTGEAYRWLGAFGEGFAMLAAAGGPDVHPHAASPEADRTRWDRDVARFDQDLRDVERFFLDVIEGRLQGEAISSRAFEFFGVQGPWYTVGWRMAVTIERTKGRDALLACMLDPRKLLPTFNEAVDLLAAAGEPRLATWSEKLIAALTQK